MAQRIRLPAEAHERQDASPAVNVTRLMTWAVAAAVLGAITPYATGALMLTTWRSDPLLNLWIGGLPTLALVLFDPSPVAAIYLVSFVYGLQYLALFGAASIVFKWIRDAIRGTPDRTRQK